ncbi:MAG: phosphotransferase [Proteobacteria bacterium]|nr:phosphotransferase [Pseudomonadota bacterium]
MKAFILAAGYGTRLKPYTDSIPKPLFTVCGKAILDRTIDQLIYSGCQGIIINTHHLHEQIEHHIQKKRYPVPVVTRHEKEILDTGGGIRNVADFLGSEPFLVVNGDIVTDVDYNEVYQYHLSHSHPVTLVLHDYPEFNCVATDSKGFVKGFYLGKKPDNALPDLAFTGIQVIDPQIISMIPETGPYSSIDLYRNLIENGPHVKALVLEKPYWIDMGTPKKYLEACRELTAPRVFEYVYKRPPDSALAVSKLAGDGSDRTYYRLQSKNQSLILSDHGITLNAPRSEAASFVAIGRHLRDKMIPVPIIYDVDLFSGQVYMEDLGDVHLDHWARQSSVQSKVTLYRSVLGTLARMSVDGAKGFQSHWTCQTSHYDHDLIMERECHYFISAFANGVLGMNLPVTVLDDEFSVLADRALSNGCTGFMHRDFQSRNIMVKDQSCHIIDFQGGRMGPVQYDLASLLIDPYAGIDPVMQDEFLSFFLEVYSGITPVHRADFIENYIHVRITRNLQMLGAFGYLSRVKGKKQFEAFIPPAVISLKRNITHLEGCSFKGLKKIIEKL